MFYVFCSFKTGVRKPWILLFMGNPPSFWPFFIPKGPKTRSNGPAALVVFRKLPSWSRWRNKISRWKLSEFLVLKGLRSAGGWHSAKRCFVALVTFQKGQGNKAGTWSAVERLFEKQVESSGAILAEVLEAKAIYVYIYIYCSYKAKAWWCCWRLELDSTLQQN